MNFLCVIVKYNSPQMFLQTQGSSDQERVSVPTSCSGLNPEGLKGSQNATSRRRRRRYVYCITGYLCDPEICEKWQFVDFIYAWLYMEYGRRYTLCELYLCNFCLIRIIA